MRKLFLLVVLILLTACTAQNNPEKSEYKVNDYSEATMTIVEGSVSNTGLIVEFNYIGDNRGEYSEWYSIEYLVGNEWFVLPYDRVVDAAWTAEAYGVEKGKLRQVDINWENLYGELPSGYYRIVKDFTDFRGTGDYDKYYFASEFTIE